MENSGTSQIESKARELLEGRIASVSALEAALGRLEEARASVTAAEKDADDAWGQAATAGWTDSELRQLGLGAPKRKTRIGSAPRRRAHASSKPADDARDGIDRA